MMKRALIVLALSVPVAVGLVPIVEPALAAYACPSCFGLERVDATTYIETAATADQRRQVAASVGAAKKRVASFFGGMESDPRLLVCVTEPCDRRLGGGGARGTSYGHWFVRISPRGVDEIILTHELFHTELRSRLGYLRPVPAWLDEGLAVVVSRDERYVHVGEAGRLTCRVEPAGNLPEGAKDWRRSAGRGERPIYAMAACRALRWLDANGGQEGFARALQAAADGERPLR